MELAPDFAVGNISISLWYHSNNPQDDIGTTGGDGGPDGIYDSLAGTSSGYQLFLLPPGRVNGRFETEDGGFVVVNSEDQSNLEANDAESDSFEWHHVAYTADREAEEALLYINGALASFGSPAGDVFDLFEANVTPSQDLWIGRANQHGADGMLDDFALFDQVLTKEEIQQLFEQTLSPADFLDAILGDFNGDGSLSADDIDLLTQGFGGTDLRFALDGNGSIELADQVHWVETIYGTVAGDTDLNRTVDFSDFLVLSNKFSQLGGWSDGDFDGDGSVGFPDFLALSANSARPRRSLRFRNHTRQSQQLSHCYAI